MPEQETKQRIRAIMTQPNARAMPFFAEHIAFTMDCDAEAAAAMMAAAAVDMAMHTSAGGSANYIQRKTEAGSLGLAEQPYSDGAAAAGWAKAAKQANARFEDAA